MMNKYRLMSPGPTPIPPEVSAAGAMPIIHHRTPEFGEVFTRVNESLKRIFLTENDIFTYAASGTGAFEGTIQNLFSPGDKVLVVNNGNFGNRWVKMSKAFGLEVTELEYDWGVKADNNEVAAGSQKALMTPPGLGFVSVSERAMRAHEESTMPRYYFDWTAAKKAYAK